MTNTTTKKREMSGSQRRFLAFWVAFIAVVGSHYLQLSGEALTSLVALALGYMGQGALKEVHMAGRIPGPAAPSDLDLPPDRA